MNAPLKNSIAALVPVVTEWRRDFHQHPELLYEVGRTASLVAERLRSFGFDSVEEGVGVTGVVGLLHGASGPAASADKRVLFRADMDALPILEATSADYASKTPGKMHACGHDGHTALLLGAAKHLADVRDFDGTLVFCFQPAEEGGAGAKAMMDDGLFARHPVKGVYGLHNWPGIPVGHFGVARGPAMAGAYRFDLIVKGYGGHAAMPHLTRDPIVAAAEIVLAAQTIVSRVVDPLEPAVVSITSLHGGEAYNVIPDRSICGSAIAPFRKASRRRSRRSSAASRTGSRRPTASRSKSAPRSCRPTPPPSTITPKPRSRSKPCGRWRGPTTSRTT